MRAVKTRIFLFSTAPAGEKKNDQPRHYGYSQYTYPYARFKDTSYYLTTA